MRWQQAAKDEENGFDISSLTGERLHALLSAPKETTVDAAGPMDVKTAYLDHPFVYLLIDCETKLPFFLGTMMDVNG